MTMTSLSEESDAEAAQATKPWYSRTVWHKILVTAAATVLAAVVLAGLSILAETPGIESDVQANESDISAVQQVLQKRVVPAVERIDERTEGIRTDVDEIKDDLDRVEQRQFEEVQ